MLRCSRYGLSRGSVQCGVHLSPFRFVGKGVSIVRSLLVTAGPVAYAVPWAPPSSPPARAAMALTAKAWARRNRASSNVAEIISPLARCIDCVCQWNWKTFFVSTKWPAITPVTVTTRSNFALAEPVDRHLDCLMELESFCCPKAVGPTAPGPTNCPKSGVCRSGWGRWTDAGRTWQMASTRTLGCRRGAVSSSQTTRSRSRSALAATALAGAAHAAGAAVVSSKGGGNTARFLNAGGTSHWPMHFGLYIYQPGK